MSIPDVIENVSQHESLSIVTYYQQITINDIWYTYEASKDRLVRCSSLLPPQAELYESDHHA